MDHSAPHHPRSRALAACLLGLGLLCLLVIPFRLDDYARSPFDAAFELRFPRNSLLAPNGDALVIDSGDRRINRIEASGTVAWSLRGEERAGGFYTATLIGPGPDGSLWIDNAILDEAGAAVADELCAISPDGAIQAPVFRWDYPPELRSAFDRHLYYPDIYGPFIQFFANDADGNTQIYQCDTRQAGPARLVGSIPGFDAYSGSVSVCALAPDRIWFLKADGGLLFWDGASLAPLPRQLPAGLGAIIAPSDLVPAPGEGFLFLDDHRRLIAIDAGGNYREAYASNDPRLRHFFPALGQPQGGKLSLVDLEGDRLWVLDSARGVLEPGPRALSISPTQSLGSWISWIVPALGLLLLLTAATVFHFRLNKRRIPLLVKQLFLFLPLIIGAVVVVASLTYQDMRGRLQTEIETRLAAWGHLGSQFVDPADIASLHPEREGLAATIESPAFGRLAEGLSKAVAGNAEPWSAAVYDYIYFKRQDELYVFDQSGYFERYLARPGMLEALADGTPRIIQYEDAYSAWYSSFTPVKDSQGATQALFELTVDLKVLSGTQAGYLRNLVQSIAWISLLLVGAFTGFTLLLLHSIRKLNTGAAQLAVGAWDTEVKIRTRDEIEDLGRSFNRMAREIQQNIETVTQLNAANSKFVPREFLSSLGHDNILQVHLGDQVEKDMTVFFSDIRNFTDISERMSPEENFRFLNHYLRTMGPQIRQSGGFIDKYIGDAIMALFPRRPDDAIHAALDLFARLEEFPDLAIGVGIHTGRLMLGVIGEEERFDGTVISDAVNLASRLESLTKHYGVSIIISDQSLAQVADHGFFSARRLDTVTVKGRGRPTVLWEIIPPSDPGAGGKIASIDEFEAALEHYTAGRFGAARRAFAALADRNPHDLPARLHRERCAGLESHAVGKDWDGITRFNAK